MSTPGDEEDTHPNLQRFKDATAKADPVVDRILAWATASDWTPWILLVQALAWVGFGWWLGR